MQKLISRVGTVALVGLVCTLFASVSSLCDAQATTGEAAGVKVGDAAPKWKNLEGVDDKQHSLSDIQDAKAILVVFTCNHCPVAKAYEDRIAELQEDYANEGVEVVAINVNNIEADRLPAMKERAEEKGFKFDYLYDPSQEIGRAFGAMVTPHAFLLDENHKVVYMGAIDDNMNPNKAEQFHLRDALDAVLEGRPVETSETKPMGCGIQYE